jgi:hippurate hydrolase
MWNLFAAPALVGLLALPAASGSPALAPLNALYPDLEAFYIDLHENPELSQQEEKTSAKMAARLRSLGYDVTEKVGGYGVVAVLKNGKGPTVLLRADMDALPVEEKTGLPYASKVTAKNSAGTTVSVMHACGHDIHMTSLIGAATLLARGKRLWRGTLVLIAQPDEEMGDGAAAMLKSGLLTRFPKPAFAIAFHDAPFLPAGTVGCTPGYAYANVDSVDITIYGRGGHGSTPQNTVDPIVIAARTIESFQTIVSREQSPLDPVVVTVGSIHGGTKHNIIPDEVKLQLTVRTYKEATRKRVLAAIARIAKAEAAAAGAPKEPTVAVDPEGLPAVYNDPPLTKRLMAALSRGFGASRVVETEPWMGGEDFGEIGTAAGVPSVLFWVGATEPNKLASAQGDMSRVPGLHSSEFAPDPEPTIKTGAAALTLVALELLGKP